MANKEEVILDYAPQPKQKLFHESDADEILYGGAAGGGKSRALFEDAVNTCLQIPGFVGAIFRKTFPELESSHIRTAKALPHALGKYRATAHEFQFINGSILEFRYCEHEDDVYKYQSTAWDGLYFDELTHFTEFQFLYLLSRVRTTNPRVRTKIKSGSNPGNIGHGWVKDRYVTPAPPFETWNPDRSLEEIKFKIPPRTRCFIPAKLDDNQILVKADPSYRINLLNLPEDKKRALYDGDWDVYEGQYFAEWRREHHVVEPFQIEPWWTRFMAYDHGYSHNAVCGWFCVDEMGQIFLYRELVMQHESLPNIARAINQYSDTKDIYMKYGPRDLLLPPRDGIGKSVHEQFGDEGINFIPAVMDRIQGWSQLHQMLAWKKKSFNQGLEDTVVIKPRFQVFSTCVRTIACIPSLIHDPHRPEDVLKVNCNGEGEGGDDCADMVRYGLMSRPLTSIEPEGPDTRNRIHKRRATKDADMSIIDAWNHD